jgi:hypothetical protein
MIKDWLNRKGRTIEIPDTDRNDFARFLFENGYRTGAEIGVNQGEYGKILCGAGLKVYGIDCFENYEGYKRVGEYECHYEEAAENLKEMDYTIIRKYSMDALRDFADSSLDFVYIDANHTLPYVCMDIFGWERKVRQGGIIAGHDYAVIRGFSERKIPAVYDGCHVKAAVNACVDIMRIPKLYVLGAKEKDGRKRDKWRTWFFFRP